MPTFAERPENRANLQGRACPGIQQDLQSGFHSEPSERFACRAKKRPLMMVKTVRS
jgi:hypothetical protein